MPSSPAPVSDPRPIRIGTGSGGRRAVHRMFTAENLLLPRVDGGTEFSPVRFHGDIAEAVAWVVGPPPHVNINRGEMMPTSQAPGPFIIKWEGS